MEDFAREKITDNIITHDFSHFKRVAIGARWFVKILNGTQEEEELAYIAGLLHDCVRPDTEKVDHAFASADKAREILKGFDLDSDTIEKIVQAVKDHRKPVKWASPLHQSVYLADKLLEQMGHYVAFRRCIFVGECRDYTGKPFEDSIIHQFEYRLNKFNPTKFPKFFQPMAKQMLKPSIGFYESFKRREEWAIRLGKFCYDNVKEKSRTMDEIIRDFVPDSDNAEKYKKEALDYMNGNKFKEFETLLK